MRHFIKIVEGVEISSPERLAAYVITVAETYNAAPLFDKNAQPYWRSLIDHTTSILFKQLKSTGIKLVYTSEDYSQYTTDNQMMIKYMLYDMCVNKQLKVYTEYNTHPVFREEENLKFRAAHDFYTHGILRKIVTAQLAKLEKQIGTLPTDLAQAGPIISQIRLDIHGNQGISFGARGEFNAAVKHMLLAPENAAPAIFTEVIGQVCYQVVTGDFGEQKVAILPGFDYKKIGKCLPYTEQDYRYNQLLSEIEREVEYVKSPLGNIDISSLMDRISR